MPTRLKVVLLWRGNKFAIVIPKVIAGRIGSILGIIVSSYLPVSDPTIKNILGATLGNFVEKGASQLLTTGKQYIRNPFSSYMITIDQGRNNPIYDKIEAYIMHRHLEKIKKCPLEPMDGEIILKLKESEFLKYIDETYKGHKIYLRCNTSAGHEKIQQRNQIYVTSRTASVEILKNYIESICHYRRDSRLLRIYRVMIENLGNDNKSNTITYWNPIITLTNKTIENTILNREVEKEIYEDAEWFINNQNWYNQRGIPYKRGYLLYGKPGTGKTSVIKAIANQYHLDIFSMQMDGIRDNPTFTLLMAKIGEFVGNKPYILALEDFDRCSLFDRYGCSNISLATILNELDGVTESYGRLLFITCNDRSKFFNLPNVDALFRPGRVDKEIELKSCDQEQLIRIVKHFSDVDLPANISIKQEMNPATLISILQKNDGTEDEVINICQNIDGNTTET